MSTKTTVNGQTVVHENSGGIAVTFPDVCMTPVGNPLVPIPYVNVAKSIDAVNGSKTVTVDGHPIMLKDSDFSISSGNEAGTGGGVSSGVIKGKAKFVNYSNDVFIEGKPACRRLDPMVSNLSGVGNTPPTPLMQPNVEPEGVEAEDHVLTLAFVFEHPDTITGRVAQPLMTGGYTLTGPETVRSDADGSYVGFRHSVGSEGRYSVELAGGPQSEKITGSEKA